MADDIRRSASSATRCRSAPISSRTATTFSARERCTKDRATTTGPSRRCHFDFDTDRWYGEFAVDRLGRWTFTVEAWTDALRDVATRAREEGRGWPRRRDAICSTERGSRARRRASARFGAARASLLHDARKCSRIGATARSSNGFSARSTTIFSRSWRSTIAGATSRDFDRELAITVDRERARFGAWYELFPRSQVSPETERSPRHGTFADAAARLPRIAAARLRRRLSAADPSDRPHVSQRARTTRSRPSRTTSAVRGRSATRTADTRRSSRRSAPSTDFDRFVAAARDLGLEIALDYALQCSPDHPWVKEHPDWFFIRPDGTIKYAENPPKKYQDIYPLNFWCADREGLVERLPRRRCCSGSSTA